MKYQYLLWLAIFVWVPTLVLWLTNFDLLKRYKKTLGFCIFWALVFTSLGTLLLLKLKSGRFRRKLTLVCGSVAFL